MSEHFDSVEDRDEPIEERTEDEDRDDEDKGPNPWAKTSSGDAENI
jgi:hypothetical protein